MGDVSDHGGPEPPEPDPAAAGGEPADRGLSISAVSDLLGVPAPTIRSWERRYALPTASRSAGGHRRYSAEDLELLRRMRDEVARGRSAADAGTVARAALPGAADTLVTSLLDAARAVDGRRFAEQLDRAHAVLGLDRTVEAVLLPALREIGRLWSEGVCDVAHEHAASAAAQAWLARVRLAAPPPHLEGPVVLACGPLDQHTLALECLGTLLTLRGADCRLLGARTPVESLLLAVAAADAAAVVVVSSLASGRRAAARAVRAVAATGLPTYYGGSAFAAEEDRARLPGRYLGGCVVPAADRIVADRAR